MTGPSTNIVTRTGLLEVFSQICNTDAFEGGSNTVGTYLISHHTRFDTCHWLHNPSNTMMYAISK